MAKHVSRVYCDNIETELFKLSEDCYAKIVVVLRLKIGDELIVFNPKDGEWACTIESVVGKTVTLCKRKTLRSFFIHKKIGLAFCPVKTHNTSLIIEKCTELGVTDFWPIKSKFTHYGVKPEKIKMIAKGATEQCDRLDVPRIHPEVAIEEFINSLPPNFCWLSAIERSDNLPRIVDLNFDGSINLGCIVGPEGGFSELERNLLMGDSTISIKLSNNVLRTETASIVAVSQMAMISTIS
jgi:16S rRNA (uracil1498-N3)-methyltransferase